MNTPVFGRAFSRAVLLGALRIKRHNPVYTLEVAALESDFIPTATSRSSKAFGLFQRLPPYHETRPEYQVRDYYDFTVAQLKESVSPGELPEGLERECLYCLNLAPARMRKGAYKGRETVLYSRHKRHGLAYWKAGYDQNAWLDPIIGADAAAEHWAPGEEVPKVAQGPDGRPVRKGWIALGDLGPGMDKAVKKNFDRFQAECEMLWVENLRAE